MHELLAHQPHLVQQRMQWLRAANHDNYTHECVDEEDVPCETWPWVESGSGTPLKCGGVPVGSPIDGYFGEGYFYYGKWPQRDGQIQCRRFPDEPLRSTTVMSPAGNTIFLTSASQGDGCGADWLIPGAGYVTASNCLSGFEHVHTGSDPELPSPIHTPYAAHSGALPPCQHLFDRVSVVSNSTEFLAREDTDPHDVDLHNAILAKVRTPGMFAGIEFDQLDHEAREWGNHGLGRFSRTWDGTGYSRIFDSRLPLVRRYYASRDKWLRVSARAELVIVKVWFVLDLALPHTKTVIPEVGTVLFDRYEHIEPHCVVRIHVWLGLRVDFDPLGMKPPPVTYTDGNLARWPDIGPPGNEILLAQEPGQWQWPPAFVEWRGVLNNSSNPALHGGAPHGQGFPKQVGGEDFSIHGPYDRSLKSACTALGTWTVPGAPVHLDHNSDNPNQHWVGEIGFNFTTTDAYGLCAP